MFDEFDTDRSETSSEDAFNLLQELEKSKPDEIRRQRGHFRVAVKSSVVVRPGNSSERLKIKVKGVTGDVSESGLRIMVPIPCGVGDIYCLEFDQEKLNLPLTFARCVRCHLIRENAFDCGFSFFSTIALPSTLAEAANQS
jgi:PilZ domain